VLHEDGVYGERRKKEKFMEVFIILVIAAVVIFFVVRQGKRKKAIEDLKNGSGYQVALEIKEELSKKGYKIGDLSIDFTNFIIGDAYGSFYISSYSGGNGISDHGGKMVFSRYLSPLISYEWHLQSINMGKGQNFCYGIENANIRLLVYSSTESQKMPLFLKIAAEVIKRSGYAFEHPNWFNEIPEARKYLNVMFQ
jgi:hypothetical protein